MMTGSNIDSQSCTIGLGELSDIPGVMTVMDKAFDPIFGEAWSQMQLSGLLITPGSWLLLLRVEDEIAGFSIARSTLDEAELMLLAISPVHRRKAFGARLLQSVVDEARTRGAQRLFLEMRADNDGALGLYGKAGFIQVGRRPRYYRGADGVLRDAITMALPLR